MIATERGTDMSAQLADDPILRENRRSALARRLILHGVRTRIVSRLTGLSRNRLATIRRRLMVSNETRPRGPTRRALKVFLCSSKARMEGAALASLFSEFQIPFAGSAHVQPGATPVELGERLCETYEAYRACCPRSNIQLEELVALRNSLATGDTIRVGRCRSCKCLILIDRYNGSCGCSHCDA